MPDITIEMLFSIILIIFSLLVILAIVRSVRMVSQGQALVVERFGRFQSVLYAGLHFIMPFIDRIRSVIDLREQVVSFAPQPVITSDNLVVSIDTVLYFQVTDPKGATYEISNYIVGIEQLTVTTLRNVIGSMDLEQTLTSRDQINGQLRGVLDEATTKWGIRVNRVELKAIDPPASIQGSMEQQMRAERDRRAAILTAEGVKQSQILTAEGEKQSAILRAEGEAQATILRAQGDSRAILQVFDAIHKGNPDPKLLAYQYLQMLPQVANGTASKMWVIPAEFTAALQGITGAFAPGASGGDSAGATLTEEEAKVADSLAQATLEDPNAALKSAKEATERATSDARDVGQGSGRQFDPNAELGLRPSGSGSEPIAPPRYDTQRPIGGPGDGPLPGNSQGA